MLIYPYTDGRANRQIAHNFDLVVVGGGMSGVCAAITAAREGLSVALVQDRAVLGGNASSEVRLWVLGATSHMGNNNRFSREGGVIDEILVENTCRNREGNPILFDTVLLDKVLSEKNISLFLNTAVHKVNVSNKKVTSIIGFNSQNATQYTFAASLFVDASGDGIVAYNAGASFRVGAEEMNMYNEKFAPDPKEYGEFLGHSIFFYSKDTGKQVDYIAPDFALKEIEAAIPRVVNRSYLNSSDHGCKYWWLEYGGRLDTIYDTEKIKYELWRVVYGVWDYIKNSGKFPETKTHTIEWVGAIPGKRESRRFAGLYTLTQNDVIKQNLHQDAVAYGGWSIDLHPSDGVYSPLSGCNQWHSKGVYQIPYRCYVSVDIENLFLAGRLISASHVAHGSSRVMCTCAHGAQAVGMAAAICKENDILPKDILDNGYIKHLQQRLVATGQYIPHIDVDLENNIANNAQIEPSSELRLTSIAPDGTFEKIDYSIAQLIPIDSKLPKIKLNILAQEATILDVEICKSIKVENFTPEITLASKSFNLDKGIHSITLDFNITHKGYLFVCLMKNPLLSVSMSSELITGITTVYNIINEAVSNYGKQSPVGDIGVDEFEFWCPKRRPESRLMAMDFVSPIESFSAQNIKSSIYRPVVGVNGWVATKEDHCPSLELRWDKPEVINNIRLFFDTDFDHAMENVQMGHYDQVMPHCVRNFTIEDTQGRVIHRVKNNYKTVVDCPVDLMTDRLIIKFEKHSAKAPISVMGLIINK